MSDLRTAVQYWARRPLDAVRQIRRLAADPACPRWLGPLLVVSAAYLAFPFDLIPDFIPIIGQLDDVLVVVGLAALFRVAIPPELLRRYFVEPIGD